MAKYFEVHRGALSRVWELSKKVSPFLKENCSPDILYITGHSLGNSFVLITLRVFFFALSEQHFYLFFFYILIKNINFAIY